MSDCGTHPAYQAHRRNGEKPCKPCSQAHVKYEKRRTWDASQGRPRQIAATGTERRVQALVALGWTYGSIGEPMGVTAGAVYRMATRYSPTVFRSTAEKVAAVYEQMSMTLPPTETRQQKRDASYARTVARKRGWVVPLAWDDDTIDDPEAKPQGSVPRRKQGGKRNAIDHALIERVLAGEWSLGRMCSKAERVEIATRWHREGGSMQELERLTGWRPDRYYKTGDAA